MQSVACSTVPEPCDNGRECIHSPRPPGPRSRNDPAYGDQPDRCKCCARPCGRVANSRENLVKTVACTHKIGACRDSDMSSCCRCFGTLPCRCQAKLLIRLQLFAVAEGRQVTNAGHAQTAAAGAGTPQENSRFASSRLPGRCKKTSSGIPSGDARYGDGSFRIVTF